MKCIAAHREDGSREDGCMADDWRDFFRGLGWALLISPFLWALIVGAFLL